jgi:putative aminopeptidase FrvX
LAPREEVFLLSDETSELLRELTEASGISGYEQEVREIIRKHLQKITVIEQDRVGCALVIDVIKNLVRDMHPNTVYGVGTVHEEVGLRGARTSAWVVEPDVGLTMETGVTGDVPDVKKEDARGRLGKGPVIVIRDGSMIPNLRLRDLFIETAEELKILYQFDLLDRGGTDSGAIHLHRRGVPNIVVAVPTWHIHSHADVIHRDDYDQTVRLVTAVIKKLNADTMESLTK